MTQSSTQEFTNEKERDVFAQAKTLVRSFRAFHKESKLDVVKVRTAPVNNLFIITILNFNASVDTEILKQLNTLGHVLSLADDK